MEYLFDRGTICCEGLPPFATRVNFCSVWSLVMYKHFVFRDISKRQKNMKYKFKIQKDKSSVVFSARSAVTKEKF